MNRPFRRGQGNLPKWNVPPAVVHANELFTSGDYLGAAKAFEKLAQGAKQRGQPAAGRFSIRAGESYVLAGKPKAGVPLIEDGISTLAAAGRMEPLEQLGPRVVKELNQQNLCDEADQITALLRQHIPNFSLTAPGPMSRVPLPSHCPGCGAPLRPDEVEWLSNGSAQCEYCGTVVTGQS